MKSFKYQNFIKRKNDDFSISGIAMRVELKHSINRSVGIPEWGFIYFYSPVTLSVEGKVYTSQKGGFTLLPPNTPHSIGSTGESPGIYSWLYFNGGFAEKILKECRIPYGTFLNMERFDVFEKYFLQLNHELSECPYQDYRIVCGIFDLIFRELSREIFCHAAFDIPARMRNIFNRITSTPPSPVDLSELAESSGISKSHLSAEFKRYYGMSPVAAFNANRLNYAKYLLSDSNHTVSGVAEAAGYGDVYQFSKAFKKFFGYSPSKQHER